MGVRGIVMNMFISFKQYTCFFVVVFYLARFARSIYFILTTFNCLDIRYPKNAKT